MKAENPPTVSTFSTLTEELSHGDEEERKTERSEQEALQRRPGARPREVNYLLPIILETVLEVLEGHFFNLGLR